MSSAKTLDGKGAGEAIRELLRPRIAAFRVASGRSPGLGILLAGNDGGSQIYVRNKVHACEELGIVVDLRRLSEDSTVEQVTSVVNSLNRDESIDAILVQSPLPAGMGAEAEKEVFNVIDPGKDVDGFCAVNVGRLAQNRSTLAPATPSGIIELLDRSKIQIQGAHAVIIGRSDIVGKPMAMLMLHRHATVTICHSRTQDLAMVTSRADILISAVGHPGLVIPKFVKPGSTVIDVGTTRVTDRRQVSAIFGEESPRLEVLDRRGAVVVGDVHPGVASVAGAVTPVPGGVGPLTIAMLLSNTVKAAETRLT
ncbi:MAG: bifunctional methylenetetrahydrofolate dehydrogenase/methenyltetrahydrofolate cyclohydrolase [Acidobacteria bacterium]|nr:bifunctional methylenetetrahydrofolate dehydrogenase/methenyltetrahydrofolate cyclohydrolase [Acidobacteriota bacterium]|tara:strand:+ start:420 stop:1349 length:930 start_codon:yes stop_codon:yes gene_type:complete